MNPGEVHRYKGSNFPLLTSSVGLSKHDVTKEIDLPELKSSLVESSKEVKHEETISPSDDVSLRRSRSRSPDEIRRHTKSLTTDDVNSDLKRSKGVYFTDIDKHQDESDDHMTEIKKQKLQKMLNDLSDNSSLPSRPKRHRSLAPLPPVVSKGQRSWKPCFEVKRKPRVGGSTFKTDGSKAPKKPVPTSDVRKHTKVSTDHVPRMEKQQIQRDLKDQTSLPAVPRRHRSLAPVPPVVTKGQRSKSCYEAKRKPKAPGDELPSKIDGSKTLKTSSNADDSGAHVTMVEKDKLDKMKHDLGVPVRRSHQSLDSRRHQSLDSRRLTAAPTLQGQRSKSCYTSTHEASRHGAKDSEWQKNTALPPLVKQPAIKPLNLDAPDARIRAKKIKIRHTKTSKRRRQKKQEQMAVVAKQGLDQKKHKGKGASTEYQPPSHLNAYPRIEVRGNNTKTKIPKPKVDMLLQCKKVQVLNRHDSKNASRIPVQTPRAIPLPVSITGSPKSKRYTKGFQKARKKIREISGTRLKPKRSVPLSARAVIRLTNVADNSGSPNTATPCRAAGRSVSLGSIPGSNLSSYRVSLSPCMSPKPLDMKELSVSRPSTARNTCRYSDASLKSGQNTTKRTQSVNAIENDSRVASGRQSPKSLYPVRSHLSVALSDADNRMSASPLMSRKIKRSASEIPITPRSRASGQSTDIPTYLKASPPVSCQSKRSMSVASVTPRSVNLADNIDRSTRLDASPPASRQSKRSMSVESTTPRSANSGRDTDRSVNRKPSPPVSRQSKQSMSAVSTRSANSGRDKDRYVNWEPSPPVSRQSKRSMSVVSTRSANSGRDTDRSVNREPSPPVSSQSTARSSNLDASPPVSHQSKRPMTVATITPRSVKSGPGTDRSSNLEGLPPVSRQSKRSMSVACVTPRSAKSGHSTDKSKNLEPSPPVNRQSKRSMSVASTTPRSSKSGRGTDRSSNLEPSPPVSHQSKRSMSVATITPRSAKSGRDTDRSTNLEASPPASRQPKRSMYVASVTHRSAKWEGSTDRSLYREPPVSRQSRRARSVVSTTPRSAQLGHGTNISAHIEASSRLKLPWETNNMMSHRSGSESLSGRSDVSLRRKNRASTWSEGESLDAFADTPTIKTQDRYYAKETNCHSSAKSPTNSKTRSANNVDSRMSTPRSETSDTNGHVSSRASTRSSRNSVKYDTMSSASSRVDSVKSPPGFSVKGGKAHISSRSSTRASTSAISTVYSRSSTPLSDVQEKSSRVSSRSSTRASTKFLKSDTRTTSRVDPRTSTPSYSHSTASISKPHLSPNAGYSRQGHSGSTNYSSNALVHSTRRIKSLRVATASTTGKHGSSSTHCDRRYDSTNSDEDMDCIKGIYSARSN